MGFLICDVYAAPYVRANCPALNVKASKIQIDLRQKPFLQDQSQVYSKLARRGCCSWHKGVCGCSGGRAVCCDGTLSPTCGC